MLLFAAWFSAYSIRLHAAHLTHTADLGQIHLAISNTAAGRFVQEIKGEAISTRLTDHVEPLFLLLAPAMWLWNDARMLLILQAVALALGAWPVFLLTRKVFGEQVLDIRYSVPIGAQSQGTGHQYPIPNIRHLADAAGVIFAAAYLLAPALQAAAVSEFHALPFAAPLIAWALWTFEQRRWGRFALAALLLMSVQEGMALLAAGLGLYAVASVIRRRKPPTNPDAPIPNTQYPFLLSLGVLALGLAWFYLTTFVIIPHYAGQVYGVDQTPYTARYGQLGDSFGDVLAALITRPWQALRIAAEPLRRGYLIGLLAPTGFLALLAPEFLLLAAPLLLANLFSSFPFQYAGELHYSAPLVPYLVTAAAYGLVRLWRRSELLRNGLYVGQRRRHISGLALLLLGVAACALTGQILAGYTPLGRQFWLRVPGGWPAVTQHQRLLSRFTAQIPPGVAASATSDLYPHLSDREWLYQFPLIGQRDLGAGGCGGRHRRSPCRHPGRDPGAVGGWLGGGGRGRWLCAAGAGPRPGDLARRVL